MDPLHPSPPSSFFDTPTNFCFNIGAPRPTATPQPPALPPDVNRHDTGLISPSSSNSTSPRPRNNSKKRSRASRRTPTTVLTTDAANFRAMVQELTGIQTPPFMPYSSLRPNFVNPLGPIGTNTCNVSISSSSSSAIHTATTSTTNYQLSNHCQSTLVNMQQDPTLAFKSLQSPELEEGLEQMDQYLGLTYTSSMPSGWDSEKHAVDEVAGEGGSGLEQWIFSSD